MGSFLVLLLLLLCTPSPPVSRPISQPGGPYPSLQAQISVLRPKSHPQGPNPNPKAQIPLSIQWNHLHFVFYDYCRTCMSSCYHMSIGYYLCLYHLRFYISLLRCLSDSRSSVNPSVEPKVPSSYLNNL